MTTERRYDVDWLRVISIGLLLIYHVAIGFQPWGLMIGFITNDESWGSIWPLMAMLNVWRIPLLFFVSGMGVFFAMQRRNWRQLLLERVKRILVPLVLGVFVIVPLQTFLLQRYYGWPFSYQPGPGHLWFLGNILVYVLLLLPMLYYLKRRASEGAGRWFHRLTGSVWLFPVVIIVFIVEVWLVDPIPYELYAMTWHGFFLGLLAFLGGFCLVLAGDRCRLMLVRWRWLFLSGALLLYGWRLCQPGMHVPNQLPVAESMGWIFGLFAFGARYLNHSGKVLRYLSEAAYPIYVLHMLFLFLASWLLFPLSVDVRLKFFLVLLLTMAGSFGCYALVIRRIPVLRFLFGLSKKEAHA